MSADDKKPRQPPLGRPKAPLGTTRCNRIVTFVTNAELKRLQDLAETEQRVPVCDQPPTHYPPLIR